MEHTIALIQLAHQGDEEARTQLVKENIGLIWCVAKRYFGRGVEEDDLFQIGSIGLLKAIDRFDLQFEVKFSTYAVPMIHGEIRRFLREDRMIKVSRSLKELSYQIFLMREKLREQGNHKPTIEELAEALRVEREEIVEAMESEYDVLSLYQPVEQEEGCAGELIDRIKEEKEQEEEIVDRLLLLELLDSLPKCERQLIYLRYFRNQTQEQAGKLIGMSQVQVSRMEKKILMSLRRRVYFQ